MSSRLLGAGGTAVPEETFFAVRLFLEAMARERPLIVVFDDVHWGESTFLDLVEHVADWSREAPILLACIARTELIDVRPTWGGGKLNATAISLEPLTEEECDLLIANLLGAAEFPPGREPSAAFDGKGSCFVEMGDGVAAYATGDFYADGAPRVRLHRAGRHWHIARVAFERYWLRRWF